MYLSVAQVACMHAFIAYLLYGFCWKISEKKFKKTKTKKPLHFWLAAFKRLSLCWTKAMKKTSEDLLVHIFSACHHTMTFLQHCCNTHMHLCNDSLHCYIMQRSTLWLFFSTLGKINIHPPPHQPLFFFLFMLLWCTVNSISMRQAWAAGFKGTEHIIHILLTIFQSGNLKQKCDVWA